MPIHAPKPIIPLFSAVPLLAPDSLPPCTPDFMPLQRLRSPIHLADSCISPPPPPASCSRRRPKTASRRRRLAPRVNCRMGAPIHAFDELPWISTLEAAPELTNPWDIADLSLIPDLSLFDSSLSGPGPVRRRKSSSPRTNPINTPPSSSIRDTSSLLPLAPLPTPRSHFLPSRVLFHNLMPVSCCEQPYPCVNSSRITF